MSVIGDALRRIGLRAPKSNPKKPRPGIAQHRDELPGLLNLARNARSYLEVGTRYGMTFNAIMRTMPAGSRGVAVDLPDAAWGADSEGHLRAIIGNLRADGYDVHLILGDSTRADIVDAVRALGPFDLALIDGDHLYEGVKKDWLNYGPMARTVVFHDIVGTEAVERTRRIPVEVPRLWQEIRASGARTEEIVGRGSNMGLGVVYREGS